MISISLPPVGARPQLDGLGGAALDEIPLPAGDGTHGSHTPLPRLLSLSAAESVTPHGRLIGHSLVTLVKGGCIQKNWGYEI